MEYEIGQKVYMPMYDSFGKIVVIAKDEFDCWYGVKCIDGKFGKYNCDGYENEIIERTAVPITGSKCEWFLECHIDNKEEENQNV